MAVRGIASAVCIELIEKKLEGQTSCEYKSANFVELML
jgi:hypothetical protein